MKPITTPITEMLGIQYPIIAGPMFLVSDAPLVAAVSECGGLGAMPSLNWRKPEDFQKAIQEVKLKTSKPFGVNLIVNQANPRLGVDLEICVQEKVPLIITSLGNPKDVIQKMHAVGSKVFCDVTDLQYAQKVESLGADAVIAVSQGAGGHAGNIAWHVLIPYLKQKLAIPIVAAGGVVQGNQVLAAQVLGASAVQIGTRFIASLEAKVDEQYKQAILNCPPEKIVLTKRISGTPVSVIQTPYIEKLGTDVSALENYLLRHPKTKKIMKTLRTYIGSKALEAAIKAPTFKEVWSAGQGAGLIHQLNSVSEIMDDLIKGYWNAVQEIKK